MSQKKHKMSSNQNSVEKGTQTRKKEKKQISDKKEIEDITEFITQGQKDPSLIFPSYNKSYSQTRFELTTFDYIWKIEKFKFLTACIDTLDSPRFAERNEYMVQMNISRQADDSLLSTIQFYLCTDIEFTGLCTTTITHSPDPVCFSSTISGRMKNKTLLIEISAYSYDNVDTLTMNCKFEIFHQLINNTIHMSLIPSSTIFKNIELFEDPNLESESDTEKSLKFIVGEEHYVISKKLLCATNSSYFKNICLTHKEREKDMTNELITNDELETFKQILLYILTGSINEYDYAMLKKLLLSAHKYDLLTLKYTCEHYLLRHITIKNVVELIQLSFSCNGEYLKTHSGKFIKLHKKELLDTKEFRNLPQEDFNEIMELIENGKVEISIHKFYPSSPTSTT